MIRATTTLARVLVRARDMWGREIVAEATL
jgi:hypothetical protein